ncbi:beta strand repeat-containing protein [Luteolibacter sp. Populi]|uniref:beta strand repeat-containing protein n=1 Tax=Luteolibacter sp. Populi TaxID=3230487 RepID=UPI003466955C
MAPLLTFSSASAEVLNFNEGNSTNVWTLPTGPNLLNGTTATGTLSVQEGSSPFWATLTDGVLGIPGNNGQVVTPVDGESVTFPLDIAAQPAGYDITTFDAYATWADTGRSNQNFTLQYSTVADPLTFIDIVTVDNRDSFLHRSTHTSLTDTTGVLASGVHSVRLLFAAQENGYVGLSELKLTAVPTNVTTLLESNATNEWTLPVGDNLLDGTTVVDPPSAAGNDHGNGDITSADWSTLTDDSVGVAGDFGTSVAPANMTTVTFPLDTSENFNGYNLTSFDSYCAWANSGRDNQDITVSYSTVANPATFIKIGNAVIHTTGDSATHVRITPVSGFLATGVAAVQISFGHQENSYVGYREFIALGSPAPVSNALTWKGGTIDVGSANWIDGADNNWKKTSDGSPANFSSLSALTFDGTGINRNINLPAPLTAAVVGFSNTAATPYTFGGQLLTVTLGVASSGDGSATFNNPVHATTGVTLSGSGSLAFNGALEANGLTLSGNGGITLNAANPALTGVSSISDGTLTVSNDNGLQNAALVATGGIVRFTSAAPSVASISGISGSSIILGNGTGPVNTNLSVGDTSSVTTFAGDITAAAGTTSRLTKTGTSTQILSGVNDYTGVTTVSGGVLQFDQPPSLYNGNTASWTAGNLVVAAGGTLAFNVGTFNEFTDTDISTLALGGFQPGSALGINNAEAFTLARDLTQTGLGLYKSGIGTLTVTGNNTSNGASTIIAGRVNAASLSGTSFGGNLTIGNATADVFLNMGASNQFGTGSVLSFANGDSRQSKLNLRGFSQTLAGLDSAPLPANRVPLIQNDEIALPDYPGVVAGPVTLTLDTATDHSFFGLIRNGDGGGAVSLIKNGVGTQEFRNVTTVQAFGYSGPTTINQGALKLNFTAGNSTFASDVTINSPAILQFDGSFNFTRTILGDGKVVKTGPGLVSLVNESGIANANSYTGGTVIEEGTLKFYTTGPNTGDGNGPGQFCVAGPMHPSNVITVKSGARVGVGGVAPLGQSPVLPQFAPTINIEPGGALWGSEGTNIAFVANLNLDGATVDVTAGSGIGGFNTNMTFVGTVVVGGVSSNPSVVSTSGTGPNANVSLGSVGLPGTTFQVANVTNSVAPDLIVNSNLRNVHSNPSPLTKTGPGTMQLVGFKDYTGTTRVMEGVLELDTATLADSGNVVIDATGTLNLQHSDLDLVGQLTLNGTTVEPGIYGSTTNATPGIIQTPRITGTGTLEVTVGPAVTYDQWSAVIPNVNDRDRSDDPDTDGFTNLDEFLFGTSPIAGNASLAQFEDDGTNLIIRWNQRANSPSVYVLQESTTMENPWPASTAIITDNQFQDVPGYVSKQAVIPVTGARKFVRVQGTE